MSQYDHRTIEARWQTTWDEQATFLTPANREKPKYYVLDMFPYPSGSGLHVGHPKGYTATDIVARARRMMGFNVLRVMGWDSFGLPAERQADKEGKHPREITERNIATFKGQLRRLGLSYDWTHELATSDLKFYRWTQWIFLKLVERGLAYQAEVPVNWCPALGTVLANEEVKDGLYVETGDPVERRMMKQWMLRITAYGDRLVDDLELVDWPEGIKKQQRDWIGRSEGAEVRFVVDDNAQFEVFTTRPDTLWGCSYVVLAPEHELVSRITTPGQRGAVDHYRAEVAKRSDRDRTAQAVDAPKTGVWTGAYATNPVNGERVPVWIADYVLGGYGTGAVFACPAHDERDHAFARTHGLPIREVVRGGDVAREAYAGDGPHVNSGFLDGLNVAEAKTRIIGWLTETGHGRGRVQYRLRDWLFSRQRYWGEPFPMVEVDGAMQPLPESALPVELPELGAERGPTADGRPPLARAEAWMHTTDPTTGKPALRETNTMPQWAGSCWYYLRFINPNLTTAAWDADDEHYWMPVDLYVGGAEHAVLHLLYARFWHKVLYDLKLVSTPEPFHRLYNQGMIHDYSYQSKAGKYYYPHEVQELRGGEPVPNKTPDADRIVVKGTDIEVERKLEKMSKSKCNVVTPDEMCDQYGADALRLYELFMGPLEDGSLWETSGVAGTRRFLDRSWRLIVDAETDGRSAKLVDEPADRAVDRALHLAIQAVTDCVTSMRFNTAIAAMMAFVNEATKAGRVNPEQASAFVRILAPFAPHIAEELWQRLGHTASITYAAWPAFDESKVKVDTVTVAVQVNGKLRGTVDLPAEATEAEAIAAAEAVPNVSKWLEGQTVVKKLYVKGRLINLVVKPA